MINLFCKIFGFLIGTPFNFIDKVISKMLGTISSDEIETKVANLINSELVYSGPLDSDEFMKSYLKILSELRIWADDNNMSEWKRSAIVGCFKRYWYNAYENKYISHKLFKEYGDMANRYIILYNIN